MDTDEYTFEDITPIPIGDESAETKDVVLCKIMYTEEFKVVFAYLRALMEKGELSRRALYVACRAISLVPAHYTVWEYKYRIVEQLASEQEYDILEELEWCSDIALKNEKNYQIWHYREMVIGLLVRTGHAGDREKYDLGNEYEIVNAMLANDEKNYHVWSYKRWMVEYFGLFRNDAEMAYTEQMISADVRNNSAWNFRHFLVFGDGRYGKECIVEEIGFTALQIEQAITNPSSWNYMRFLYSLCVQEGLRDGAQEIKAVVLKYSSVLDARELDLSKERMAVPAYELLASVYRTEGDKQKERCVYTLLRDRLDPVRKNYWNYCISLV